MDEGLAVEETRVRSEEASLCVLLGWLLGGTHELMLCWLLWLGRSHELLLRGLLLLGLAHEVMWCWLG